jgi:hypothetical protein
MSMSYPIQAPVGATRRPVAVALAAALLAVMAFIGLGYAISALAVAPRVVSRFRDAATAAGGAKDEIDGFVTVIWAGAGIAVVVSVLLFALYLVLALGLRRGSPGARVGAYLVCGLGLLAGCGATVAVAAQQGSSTFGGSGPAAALADAYPGGWVGLNVTMSVAQMLGYALVAILLVATPGQHFRGGVPAVAAPAPTQSAYGTYQPSSVGPAAPAVAPGPYGAGPYATGPYDPTAYTPGPYAAPSGPPTAGPPYPAPGPDDEQWARPPS